MTIFLLDRRWSVFSFLRESFHDYFSSRQTLQCLEFSKKKVIMTIFLLGRHYRVFSFFMGL